MWGERRELELLRHCTVTLQGDDSVGCSAEHECCDHVTGTGDNEQEQGVMEAA